MFIYVSSRRNNQIRVRLLVGQEPHKLQKVVRFHHPEYMKQPNVWTVREIEGKPSECFCMINFEYHQCHSRYDYQIVEPTEFDENGHIKTIPVINKHYNPRIKKPRKPLYCERKPTDHCYKNNCPYFSYGDYDEEEE